MRIIEIESKSILQKYKKNRFLVPAQTWFESISWLQSWL